MVYHLQHSGREQDIALPRRPNSQPSPPSTKPQSTSLRITTRITTSCNPIIFSSLRTLQNGTFRNPNVFNSFCTLRKNPGGYTPQRRNSGETIDRSPLNGPDSGR